MAKKIYKNKKTLIVLAIVALAAVGGAIYIKTSQRVTGTDTTTQTHSSATKQYAPTSGGGSSAGKGGSSATGSSSTGSLAAPSGQLLNKQTISLGSTNPKTDPNLESICQTEAQASCDIRLTGPNREVKTVGAQSTGSSGTVMFDWNASTVGLTAGKWTVQAVAVKNNLTGTSHNEYLEVQP